MQQRSNCVFSASDAVTECALRYESLLYEQGVTLRSSVEDAGESALLKIRLKTVSGAVKVI